MDCSTQGFPSPTPGACSNSCPSSRWCHPTISSSAIPFSSYFHSCPASVSFPKSEFFTSGGQSIGVSTSASVLLMNTQDWSPLGLTGLISVQSKGLPRVFSNTTVQEHQFSGTQLSLWSNSQPWASLVAQTVKRQPAMQETWVRSLGWEDPLEKEMATHSRTLAWKIPWMEGPGRLQFMRLQRVRLHFLFHIHTWLLGKS